MAQTPETPLTTVEDVREDVRRLEQLGVEDELLIAQIDNQVEFWRLLDEIADLIADGETPAESLAPVLNSIDSGIGDLSQQLSQIRQALASVEGVGAPDEWFAQVENYDLNKDDWVWSNQRAPLPDVGASEFLTLFIESDDDAAFEIEVRFVNQQGVTVNTIDQNIDSDLASTSPAGANHFAFGTVDTPGRFVDVAIIDTSNGQNRIDATLGFSKG